MGVSETLKQGFSETLIQGVLETLIQGASETLIRGVSENLLQKETLMQGVCVCRFFLLNFSHVSNHNIFQVNISS